MNRPDELIGKHEKVIATAAYKFRKAAEYDDLYQEGMIAVWLSPPDADTKYINSAIFNRMKNWVRYVKRLRHYQTASYEEIVGMAEYTTSVVENLLRNYYTLQSHPDSTFSHYYVDINRGLKELAEQNPSLHSVIVNVLVNSTPIQQAALEAGVTTRQINYRLHDGLDLLTMIMNGEYVAS